MTSWSSPPLSGQRRATGTTDLRTCSCLLARTWLSTLEGELQDLLRVGSFQSSAKTTKYFMNSNSQITVTRPKSCNLLLSTGRIASYSTYTAFPCSCFSPGLPVHDPDGVPVKDLMKPLAATYQLEFLMAANAKSIKQRS